MRVSVKKNRRLSGKNRFYPIVLDASVNRPEFIVYLRYRLIVTGDRNGREVSGLIHIMSGFEDLEDYGENMVTQLAKAELDSLNQVKRYLNRQYPNSSIKGVIASTYNDSVNRKFQYEIDIPALHRRNYLKQANS